MRILILTSLYPPLSNGGCGHPRQGAAAVLRQRGHEVLVLTSQNADSAATSSPSDVRHALHLCEEASPLLLGIRQIARIELHNNTTLQETISSFKPDIVHVWSLKGLGKSLILTLQRLGIPTVFDVADAWIGRSLEEDAWLDWWNCSQPSPKAFVERSCWTLVGRRRRWDPLAPTNPVRHMQFQRLYFCSVRLRDLAVAAGYGVAHAEVIPYSIDASAFRSSIKPPSEPLRRLLCVSRFTEEGGIFTALEAMGVIQGQFVGELHVYGEGDAAYEGMLRNYAEVHHLPVSFHSSSTDELPNLFLRYDALLFTSESEESFPLPSLEAMACGLPVISTVNGGSAGLLNHGYNALTYAPGNAMQLAQCILRLAGDPNWRVQMAETAQHRARKYDLPIIADRIENYLQVSLQTWKVPSLPHYSVV